MDNKPDNPALGKNKDVLIISPKEIAKLGIFKGILSPTSTEMLDKGPSQSKKNEPIILNQHLYKSGFKIPPSQSTQEVKQAHEKSKPIILNSSVFMKDILLKAIAQANKASTEKRDGDKSEQMLQSDKVLKPSTSQLQFCKSAGERYNSFRDVDNKDKPVQNSRFPTETALKMKIDEKDNVSGNISLINISEDLVLENDEITTDLDKSTTEDCILLNLDNRQETSLEAENKFGDIKKEIKVISVTPVKFSTEKIRDLVSGPSNQNANAANVETNNITVETATNSNNEEKNEAIIDETIILDLTEDEEETAVEKVLYYPKVSPLLKTHFHRSKNLKVYKGRRSCSQSESDYNDEENFSDICIEPVVFEKYFLPHCPLQACSDDDKISRKRGRPKKGASIAEIFSPLSGDPLDGRNEENLNQESFPTELKQAKKKEIIESETPDTSLAEGVSDEVKPPPRKRGRPRKRPLEEGEIASQPYRKRIEIPSVPVEIEQSKSGRKRKKINYYELENRFDDLFESKAEDEDEVDEITMPRKQSKVYTPNTKLTVSEEKKKGNSEKGVCETKIKIQTGSKEYIVKIEEVSEDHNDTVDSAVIELVDKSIRKEEKMIVLNSHVAITDSRIQYLSDVTDESHTVDKFNEPCSGDMETMQSLKKNNEDSLIEIKEEYSNDERERLFGDNIDLNDLEDEEKNNGKHIEIERNIYKYSNNINQKNSIQNIYLREQPISTMFRNKYEKTAYGKTESTDKLTEKFKCADFAEGCDKGETVSIANMKAEANEDIYIEAKKRKLQEDEKIVHNSCQNEKELAEDMEIEKENSENKDQNASKGEEIQDERIIESNSQDEEKSEENLIAKNMEKEEIKDENRNRGNRDPCKGEYIQHEQITDNRKDLKEKISIAEYLSKKEEKNVNKIEENQGASKNEQIRDAQITQNSNENEEESKEKNSIGEDLETEEEKNRSKIEGDYNASKGKVIQDEQITGNSNQNEEELKANKSVAENMKDEEEKNVSKIEEDRSASKGEYIQNDQIAEDSNENEELKENSSVLGHIEKEEEKNGNKIEEERNSSKSEEIQYEQLTEDKSQNEEKLKTNSSIAENMEKDVEENGNKIEINRNAIKSNEIQDERIAGDSGENANEPKDNSSMMEDMETEEEKNGNKIEGDRNTRKGVEIQEIMMTNYNKTDETAKMMNAIFSAAMKSSSANEAEGSTSQTPITKLKRGRRPKTEEEMNVKIDEKGMVLCMTCNKKIDNLEWQQHNESLHYNLAWRAGEIPVKMDDSCFLRKTLKPFLIVQKKLSCDKCSAISTSINAFICHKENCYGIVSAGNVICAICKLKMEKSKWYVHKQKKHNNLAWRIGDTPLDLNNQQLVISILNALYKAKKPLYCGKCNGLKKSVIGFLSHQAQCGKEIEDMKIKCKFCNKKVLPVSMLTHIKMAHEKPVPEKKQTSNIEEQNANGKKRRAATDAMLVINTFNKDKLEQHTEFYVEQVDFKEAKFVKTILQNQFKTDRIVKCKFKNCDYVCTETEILLEHMDVCDLKPSEYSVCKRCLYVCPNIVEMLEHLKIECNSSEKDGNYIASEEEEQREEEKEHSKKKRKMYMSKVDVSHKIKPLCISRISSKPRKLFSCAFEYTLEFCNENLSQWNLFNHLNYSKSDWIMLKDHLVEQFLPKSEMSCDVVCKTVGSKVNISSAKDDLRKFELFETRLEGDTISIFCGGPIFALSWMPTPHIFLHCNQILAIATANDFDNKYVINCNYNEPSVIQFWDFDILKNKAETMSLPTLLFCLAVNFGPVWFMEWCPSGCYNDSIIEGDKRSRMGVLAVAGSVSEVYIYAIPFINEEERGLIFKPKPLLKLQLIPNTERNYFPTRISWSKASGHRYIAVGYTNGLVGVYDLETTSSLLKYKDGDGVNTILPYKNIKAHRHYISVLQLIHLKGGDHWLLTGSADRYIYTWDLRNDTNVSCHRKKMIIDGTWLTNWVAHINASEESSACNNHVSSMVYSHRNYLYSNVSLTSTPATLTCISASDWLNGIIQCDSVGDVIAIFPHQMLYSLDTVKNLRSTKYLLNFVKLIDKHESSGKLTNVDNSKMYKYEPNIYKDAKQKYGVIFCDVKKNRIEDFDYQQNHKGKLDLEESKPHLYPLQAINKIAFNPNCQASLYYTIGYQVGFVRLDYLKFLENDKQVV